MDYLSIRGNATVLHEDNVACIAQIKGGFIKGDWTKHIFLKFFYTHELQKKCEIDVQQILSFNNLADLFIKALLLTALKKLKYDIEMQRLRDLSIEMLKKSYSCLHEREDTIWIFYTLFSFVLVLSHWVLLTMFLMRLSLYSYDYSRGSIIKY